MMLEDHGRFQDSMVYIVRSMACYIKGYSDPSSLIFHTGHAFILPHISLSLDLHLTLHLPLTYQDRVNTLLLPFTATDLHLFLPGTPLPEALFTLAHPSVMTALIKFRSSLHTSLYLSNFREEDLKNNSQTQPFNQKVNKQYKVLLL